MFLPVDFPRKTCYFSAHFFREKDGGNVERSLKEGHRERLRARYLKAGGDGFPEYDMVELLLTYCIQRRDVKPIARALLNRFKDIGGIMDAELHELCEVEGMGENSALLLKLMRDLCVRYLDCRMKNTDVISSPDQLQNYARMKLAQYPDEMMMLICLNSKNHVIGSEILSRGTLDYAVIYPRNVAVNALRKKAAGVIIIHNHPSGVTLPSKADKKFTEDVRAALKSLEIRLLDHMIVSRTDAFSFVDHGLLNAE